MSVSARCNPRPVRRLPGSAFGLVLEGGDRSFSNLTVAETLAVGSEAVVPTLYTESIAARENLELTVCQDFTLGANSAVLALQNEFEVFANDCSLVAVQNILLQANEIQIVGNLVAPILNTCLLQCPTGNLELVANNTVAFTTNLTTFSGDATVDGTLNVCSVVCPTGILTLNANTVILNNDAQVGNNLAVNGTLNLCSVVCPTGTLTLNATTVTMNNNVTVNGTLNVCSVVCPTGTLTLNANAVILNNDAQVGNNLAVNGTIYGCNLVCNAGPLTLNAGSLVLDTTLALSSATDVAVGFNNASKQLTDFGNTPQQRFYVYATIGTPLPLNYPGTKLRFNVVVDDPLSIFSTSTNEATIPQTGFWISGGSGYNSGAMYVYIAVNGSANDKIWGSGAHNNSGVTGGLWLNAGDKVVLSGYYFTGPATTLPFQRINSFWMKRIA